MNREEAMYLLNNLRSVAEGKEDEAINMAIEALEGKDTNVPTKDCISRQAAIDVMWKALYAYEDLTEKQFMEHEELELEDWFQHRIFVQRMHEECMKAVEFLPSAEPKTGWIPVSERLPSAEDCPMDCMVTRKSKFVGNYVDMAVAEANGTWTHEDWKAITLDGKATCISTRDADILAWKPLTEPWKGGEDWKAITLDGKATCISTRDADILAWKPLPEPFKGGDAE